MKIDSFQEESKLFFEFKENLIREISFDEKQSSEINLSISSKFNPNDVLCYIKYFKKSRRIDSIRTYNLSPEEFNYSQAPGYFLYCLLGNKLISRYYGNDDVFECDSSFYAPYFAKLRINFGIEIYEASNGLYLADATLTG